MFRPWGLHRVALGSLQRRTVPLPARRFLETTWPKASPKTETSPPPSNAKPPPHGGGFRFPGPGFPTQNSSAGHADFMIRFYLILDGSQTSLWTLSPAAQQDTTFGRHKFTLSSLLDQAPASPAGAAFLAAPHPRDDHAGSTGQRPADAPGRLPRSPAISREMTSQCSRSQTPGPTTLPPGPRPTACRFAAFRGSCRERTHPAPKPGPRMRAIP